MHKIVKPPKGRRQALIHQKNIWNKIKNLDPQERRLFFSELKKNRKKDSDSNSPGNSWLNNRSFDDYNAVFNHGLNEMGLGNNIADALRKIQKKNNRRLLVLEDGPGRGNFLVSLKELLTRIRVPSKTTGLSLGINFELIKRKNKGLIDELEIKPGEFFVPKKQADVIISNFGSVEYVVNSIKKDHILKLAFSLRKGGIMLAGFNFVNTNNLGSIAMKEIETAFIKRGFNAKFFETSKEVQREQFNNAPPYILIVHRTNKPYIKPSKINPIK